MQSDLYLVRHGQAEANAQGLYCGITDSPLSAVGGGQAEALAAWLRGLSIAAVYSSPLRRALETARPIAAAIDGDPRVVPDLRERSYGDWEGRTDEEIRAGWPEVHRRFKEDPSTVAAPGGESCAEVAARVSAALERIASGHRGEAVAIVGHQAAWKIFLAPLCDVSMREHYRAIVLSNASATLVRFGREGPRVVWKNRTSHLGPC